MCDSNPSHPAAERRARRLRELPPQGVPWHSLPEDEECPYIAFRRHFPGLMGAARTTWEIEDSRLKGAGAPHPPRLSVGEHYADAVHRFKRRDLALHSFGGAALPKDSIALLGGLMYLVITSIILLAHT